MHAAAFVTFNPNIFYAETPGKLLARAPSFPGRLPRFLSTLSWVGGGNSRASSEPPIA